MNWLLFRSAIQLACVLPFSVISVCLSDEPGTAENYSVDSMSGRFRVSITPNIILNSRTDDTNRIDDAKSAWVDVFAQSLPTDVLSKDDTTQGTHTPRSKLGSCYRNEWSLVSRQLHQFVPLVAHSSDLGYGVILIDRIGDNTGTYSDEDAISVWTYTGERRRGFCLKELFPRATEGSFPKQGASVVAWHYLSWLDDAEGVLLIAGAQKKPISRKAVLLAGVDLRRCRIADDNAIARTVSCGIQSSNRARRMMAIELACQTDSPPAIDSLVKNEERLASTPDLIEKALVARALAIRLTAGSDARNEVAAINLDNITNSLLVQHEKFIGDGGMHDLPAEYRNEARLSTLVIRQFDGVKNEQWCTLLIKTLVLAGRDRSVVDIIRNAGPAGVAAVKQQCNSRFESVRTEAKRVLEMMSE